MNDVSFVEVRKGEFLHEIVFMRPEKLNALTLESYRAITSAVVDANQDESCSVIVIRGEGRAFSSGFDLGLQAEFQAPEEYYSNIHDIANRARWAVWDSTKPVIAAVQGYCLGGAFELTLPADFTVAAESAQFGEPEILFGAGPAFFMIPWMANHKSAKEVLLTGRRLSAREALALGLVSRVVPDEELDDNVRELAANLHKMPQAALHAVKKGINRANEVRGLRPAIDAWVESAVYLQMASPEGDDFSARVRSTDVREALAWRRARFNEGQMGTGDRGTE